MSDVLQLKAYSDIRRYVSPGAFASAMNFLAWHNRLKMTHMLDPWQALVIACAAESQAIDRLQYSALKRFLDSHREPKCDTLESCRTLAGELTGSLGVGD